MNFQKIPPVESSKNLLDKAFRRAREKGQQKDLIGNWLQVIRQKECLKIDVIKDNLVTSLREIKAVFPEEKVLPSFYQKLMGLTLDLKKLNQIYKDLDWAIQKISAFQKEYVRKIRFTKERSIIGNHSCQFYGRISSILKDLGPKLKYLEEVRQIMRTYPDIKEMFTVCIYGFPNVGKTTLLNKLTGAKAKVAAYSFTTQTINAGYVKVGELENSDKNLEEQKAQKTIQLLDVPGTLARTEKMNNIELQADLVLKELSNLIIFVFDLSGYGGYSIEKQEQLLKKLMKEVGEKKILIYLSKLDLTEPEMLEEFKEKFKQKYYSVDEIKEEMVKLSSG